MSCHHYLQVWGIWGSCHALIKCNFWACDTCAMSSDGMLHCFILLYITLCYFMLYCTLSLIGPMGPEPWAPRHAPSTHHMQLWSLVGHLPCHHYLQFWSLWGIGHVIIICSFRACDTCAIPSVHAVLELGQAYVIHWLHAVLELLRHISSHHCMQFLSLRHICHIHSIGSSGDCGI